MIELTSVDKGLSLFHEIGGELVGLEKLRETDGRKTARAELEIRAGAEQHDQNWEVNKEPVAD